LTILEQIRIRRLTKLETIDDLRIDGVWLLAGDSAIDDLQPVGARSEYEYSFALVLCGDKLGCCYIEREIALPGGWLGADARLAWSDAPEWDLALLDALGPSIIRQPVWTRRLTGSPMVKRAARAKLICDVVAALGQDSSPTPGTNIVNIGAVGALLMELQGRGFSVRACDLDPRLVGQRIGEVLIEPSSPTSSLIAGAQYILVTGMTLTNNTLDEIVQEASASGAQVIIYGQTGHGFVELLDLGVTALVSERFPPYVFAGESQVDVFF
jgi:hypothetical protein